MLQPASDFRHSGRDLIEAVPAVPDGGRGDDSFDLREIIKILRRRRGAIILATLIALAAAVIFLLLVTPRYTATATILIDPHRSNVIDSNPNRQPPASSYDSDNTYVNSQVNLIQSDGVLQSVVNSLNLAHDPEFGPHTSLRSLILYPIKKLLIPARPRVPGQSADDIAKAQTLGFLQQRRLTVKRQQTTFLIDISVQSEDPTKAAKIANAIVSSYFKELVHGKYDTNKIASSWFNDQLDRLRSKVLASDRAVEEFRAANNLTLAQAASVVPGATVSDQQLTDLNNKLIDAHAQTAEARAKFEQVQEIAKGKVDPGALSDALSSQVITQLRTQYAQVAKNLADASSKYGPQHPQVVNARAQLRETQKLINQEIQRILESARQGYQVAKAREDALQQSLDKLKHVSDETGDARVRLRELQREADTSRSLYESFLARYKETSAHETADLPDFRIVSKADIPVSPSFPRTFLILPGALLAGIGLGCLLAMALEYFDRRVKSPRQAEEVTGLPTLASIPLIGSRELASRASRGRQELSRYNRRAVEMLPAAMQPPLMRYVLEEPTSLFAESVRAVRLAVQRASRTGSVKTVVVSSSVDGEGKTTLAVNLALSLATTGLRTILMEGDLRNPEMSRSLCPSASAGVIEVASGQARFEEALFVDRSTALAILPSPPQRNPVNTSISEFVFSDAMSNMLKQLRDHFDYVIVDAPPLVPLVDARALSEIADRVILTIRWDSTPRDVVVQALDTLAPDSSRILGTVLTRVDMKRLRFYDYYRSSSYMTPYSYLGQPRAGYASPS
ncbi:MAG TPA: polysaccharide biosynthesis tyrosine autokinase [Candidatus Acidoferrales bacterium]|nr:polysaccharide biosynthesis tyrosine autokinase [Candidatus Acidoferrales bacterium]